MALVSSSVKRPVVSVGDDLATLQKTTGEHVQESAIIGENGEQIGGVNAPVQVNVVNQQAVGGRVESDRDLFGRARSSGSHTLFESVLEYDLRNVQWGDSAIASTGTVTHLPSESAAALTVAAGQKVTRITHEHFKYQAGKPNISYLTANVGTSTGTIRRVGYFDENDGVFFMNDGVENSFVIRSSVSGAVVDTVIPQNQWNLDAFDGNGVSGLTLDITKVQIVAIEVQGLGAGEIRVGFNVDSHTIYAHEFHASNVSNHIQMSTASLPLCYKISSTTGAGTLEQYDSNVISEGGKSLAEDSGMIFTANTGATGKPASNVAAPLISLRSALNFKGLNYHGTTIVNEIITFTDSTDIFWEVVLNPVLTGAAWTAVDLESASEFDLSATAATGGTVILSGYSVREGSSGFALPLQKIPMSVNSDRSGSDILTLRVVDISNKGGRVFASVNFSESY